MIYVPGEQSAGTGVIWFLRGWDSMQRPSSVNRSADVNSSDGLVMVMMFFFNATEGFWKISDAAYREATGTEFAITSNSLSFFVVLIVEPVNSSRMYRAGSDK